ncbi:MAG: hypothetical protein C0485_06965 [Pirellula sp.]|nr:hypothetical protein [Pirellula sp.]
MGQNMWGYRCALAAIASLALATPLRAEDDAASESAPSSGQNRAAMQAAAERRIEAALDSPLRAPIDFVAQPLSDVVHIISEDFQIPIVIDTSALDAVASSPDVEVSFAIGNVTLRSALELMLQSVGEGDLTYIVDNEVLMITTQEEAEKRLGVVVYRVDDLLDGDEATCERLIDVIVASVEHESWMENGTGEGEALSFPPGMIVISQTRRVHAEVERLLDHMRMAKQGIVADTAEAKAAASTQPVTRSINLNDKVIANSEEARHALHDALQKSVDWQRKVEGVDRDEFFLFVLPNRVLVRHIPEVVSQVAHVVRKVSPSQKGVVGNYGTGEGMSGRGAGGVPQKGQDLADASKAGEDKQPKPKSSGRGGF